MSFHWSRFRDGVVDALARGVLAVTADQGAAVAGERDDVLVGVGRPGDTGRHRLVLNNKGQPDWYPSVVGLVAAFPPFLTAGWALAAGAVIDPDQALARLRLVVEDASPDSVLSVIYLLARLAGATGADLPAAWTAAADRWERTGDAADPERSWAPLCAALGHCQFIQDDATGPGDGAALRHVVDGELGEAWRRCLRLTAEAIAGGQNPDALVPDGLTDFAEARAAIDAERDGYLTALGHARKTQLYLPMASNRRRRVLVDALFFVEDDPAGVKKLFVRRDRVNAPLGQGFALMAVCRGAPELVGSGNDIVVSLDCARKLVLDDLWLALEARENQHWAGQRPANQPRTDLRHAVAGRVPAADQPWYITADGTLVAAPRWVVLAGQRVPGRRVDWPEVLALIWDCFNPARFVTVLQPERGAVPLTDCRGESVHGKTLILAEFAPPARTAGNGVEREPPALILSATVRRFVAAMLRQNGVAMLREHSAAAGPIGADDLPPESAFDIIDLPGGHALVSADGCFLFNDWNTPCLDVAGCRDQVDKAARLSADLAQSSTFLGGLAQRAQGFLKGDRRHRSEAILRDVSQVRIGLARRRVELATPPADPYLRLLRASLDHRWGIERLLPELQAQAADIEESVRGLDTARNHKYLTLFAKFATPVGLALSLVDPLNKALVGFQLVPHEGFGAALWLGLGVVGAVLGWGLDRLLRGRRRSGG